MAVALSLIAVTAFYASSTQAVRIVRIGKENAFASQLLQERIDAFRATPYWSNVTTSAGISSMVTAATATAANFPKATETITVSTYYPAPTAPAPAPLTITRSPTGTITTAGATPIPSSAVKVTIKASWTGTGNIARSRQLATIMSKNGIK